MVLILPFSYCYFLFNVDFVQELFIIARGNPWPPTLSDSPDYEFCI